MKGLQQMRDALASASDRARGRYYSARKTNELDMDHVLERIVLGTLDWAFYWTQPATWPFAWSRFRAFARVSVWWQIVGFVLRTDYPWEKKPRKTWLQRWRLTT